MRAAIILALSVSWSRTAAGQPSLRGEGGDLFASLAWAHLVRAEDRTLGDVPDVGVGIRLPLARRLGVEIEVNRALGLEPVPAVCSVALPCEGSAREGLLDATLATANLWVHFGGGRVQPFVVGGAGGLWTRTVDSVTTVAGATAMVREVETSDVGLAIDVAAGLDVALTPTISVRPELRVYDANAMSRVNVTVIRTSIAAVWRWSR